MEDCRVVSLSDFYHDFSFAFLKICEDKLENTVMPGGGCGVEGRTLCGVISEGEVRKSIVIVRSYGSVFEFGHHLITEGGSIVDEAIGDGAIATFQFGLDASPHPYDCLSFDDVFLESVIFD